MIPLEDLESLDKMVQISEKPVWLDESESETTPRSSLRQALIDYSCIVLNVVSTIAIVFVNKMYVIIVAVEAFCENP